MKKFVFTLLLGVFLIGTMSAETSNPEKVAPDIEMVMQSPDVVQPVITFQALPSNDVGYEASNYITYTSETSEILTPDDGLYRSEVNSIAYNSYRLPDINRLL